MLTYRFKARRYRVGFELFVSFEVSDISHVLWELMTKACVLNSIDRILIWRVI